MGARTDRYPFGRFPMPPEYPWFEPLTMLAAIGGATLDVVSGGRLDVGVGTGWQREEYEASAIPFERRAERMDDQLRACRVLWRDAPASFVSETVRFEQIWSRPAPLQ